MKYNVEDVMEIVADMLGANATGIYTDHVALSSHLEMIEFVMLTNLEKPWELTDSKNVKVACGMSKVVLIPEYEDYVIKIPFTGCYQENYDEDTGETSYEQVCDCNWDYCDIEAANYANATSDLKEYLAETQFVGLYNNIPIYVQEKIKCSESDSNECDRTTYLDNEIDYITDQWYCSDFCVVFLKKILNKIGLQRTLSLLSEINESFDDIHDANYGYRFDGSPVIFDYSGYDECTWEWRKEVV